MADIHIREISGPSHTSVPRIKPPPKKLNNGQFFYSASDDGTDENLLILLHGLGDTHIPFSKLGKSLKLPQTAVLALRAPEQVPFLYEESYQWFTSFDDLGEMVERPNPTPALQFLLKVVDHLTNECSWPINRIHLFGFAQGGSVASEFGIGHWRQQLQTKRVGASHESQEVEDSPSNADAASSMSFGSIVTVSGPLLSYPTVSTLSPTPVLVVHRSPPAETALTSGAVNSFKKAYQNVTESKMGSKGMGMPGSKEEWEPIMRFWSQHLARRQVEGLYEVMSGMGTG
ncbi:hypothetical protein B0H34DRAFT_774248 [Crassisporium funariophilum]|nr:hypothetical protein B0H34DRAFT_774248 [Crassisporium funariophilum]